MIKYRMPSAAEHIYIIGIWKTVHLITFHVIVKTPQAEIIHKTILQALEYFGIMQVCMYS